MRRALVIAALAVAGCGKFDLGEAALVEGLRLIGVQAEPPEAFPGDQVKLTAWVFDTRGGTIDVSWSACLLPSNGLANDGCTDTSGNGVVGLGSGEELTMTVPAVDAATLGPQDQSYGVYLPIVVHVRANGDTTDGVYRLRVRGAAAPGCTVDPPFSPGCVPNHNPSFSGIDPLGPDVGPLVAHEGQAWALLAKYADGSDEEYKVPSVETPQVP